MMWRRRTPRDKVERVAHAGEPSRRSWGTTLWVMLVLTVTIGVLAPSGPASLPNEWPYNLVKAMLGQS